MEAGGDTAAPAPGDSEDLGDTQSPSEGAGDSGGVHEDPPDPRDEGLEETGMFPLTEALEGLSEGCHCWGRATGDQ